MLLNDLFRSTHPGVQAVGLAVSTSLVCPCCLYSRMLVLLSKCIAIQWGLARLLLFHQRKLATKARPFFSLIQKASGFRKVCRKKNCIVHCSSRSVFREATMFFFAFLMNICATILCIFLAIADEATRYEYQIRVLFDLILIPSWNCIFLYLNVKSSCWNFDAS